MYLLHHRSETIVKFRSFFSHAAGRHQSLFIIIIAVLLPTYHLFIPTRHIFVREYMVRIVFKKLFYLIFIVPIHRYLDFNTNEKPFTKISYTFSFLLILNLYDINGTIRLYSFIHSYLSILHEMPGILKHFKSGAYRRLQHIIILR